MDPASAVQAMASMTAMNVRAVGRGRADACSNAPSPQRPQQGSEREMRIARTIFIGNLNPMVRSASVHRGTTARPPR